MIRPSDTIDGWDAKIPILLHAECLRLLAAYIVGHGVDPYDVEEALYGFPRGNPHDNPPPGMRIREWHDAFYEITGERVRALRDATRPQLTKFRDGLQRKLDALRNEAK